MNTAAAQPEDHARHRLLIPIDAAAASKWGIAHALRIHREAGPVAVYLLYIFAPVRHWKVRRFRTEQEIHRHYEARSRVFLEEAAQPLRDAGIVCRSLFREAPPVPGILDLAEQLGCTGIVVPDPGWSDLLGRSLARRLQRARRGIPITLARPPAARERAT